jgi:hypothetical protein
VKIKENVFEKKMKRKKKKCQSKRITASRKGKVKERMLFEM